MALTPPAAAARRHRHHPRGTPATHTPLRDGRGGLSSTPLRVSPNASNGGVVAASASQQRRATRADGTLGAPCGYRERVHHQGGFDRRVRVRAEFRVSVKLTSLPFTSRGCLPPIPQMEMGAGSHDVQRLMRRRRGRGLGSSGAVVTAVSLLSPTDTWEIWTALLGSASLGYYANRTKVGAALSGKGEGRLLDEASRRLINTPSALSLSLHTVPQALSTSLVHHPP